MTRTLSRTMTHALVAAVLTTMSFGLALAPAQAAEPEPMPVAAAVADYTVFVDPPTGFSFVKLPAGWAFVGRVSAADLARLPGGVATDLLAEPRAMATGATR